MNWHLVARHAFAAAIAAALCGAPLVVAAQDEAPPRESPIREDVTTLAGMIVTAQKREEALQDVPITMEVLPQQLLRDVGARDIKEMQIVVPGLSVTSTGSETQTTARIRGVGTVGDNPGLESSVGVVIDGVYRPRVGVGFGDLGEVERVEVLKGPQGTVFGKNTSAGLINVITRAPAGERGGEVELGAGNYDALGVSASYNDALGDGAAFRVYAAARSHNGFVDVDPAGGPRTSMDDVDQDFHSVRGQLALKPTDTLDVRVIADFTSRDEECCAGVTLVRGPTAAIVDALAGGHGVIPVADPDRRLAFGNRGTGQEVEDKGISTEVNWLSPWFDQATLTSITAFRGWTAIGGTDLDYSGADIWDRNAALEDNSVDFGTFSQEWRLTGAGDRLDWMVGFYYGDEALERRDAIHNGAAYEPYLSIALLNNIAAGFPVGLVDTAGAATFLSEAAGRPYGTTWVGDGSRDRFSQDARSAALFTNETFHATDALDLTLGLRYTHEKKELDSRFANPNGGLGCAAGLATPQQVAAALAARGVPPEYLAALVPTVIGYMCLPWSNPMHDGRSTSQERSENEWSGTLKAAYRWNDAFMTYASAARGYKAGGFNLDRVQSATGSSDAGPGIVPVDDTSFPGEFVNSFELGFKSTLFDGALLLNAAAFHAKYTDFQLNSFLGTSYVVRAIPELATRGVDADLVWQTHIEGLSLQAGLSWLDAEYGDDVPTDADLALLPGARPGFAPEWQGSAALTYEWTFGDALLGRFNVAARYSSEYNTGSDLDPQKLQEAYTLVNARLGFGTRDRAWTVELWGRNVTDETYMQVGFDAPLQTGSWNAFLGAPRTWGVTLRLEY